MTGWITLIGVLLVLLFIVGHKIIIALILIAILVALQARRITKFITNARGFFKRGDKSKENT